MEFVHVPVLLDQCIEGLNIKEDGIYMDATVGGAGHSIEIVKRLTTGRLIAIDKDAEALQAANERYKRQMIGMSSLEQPPVFHKLHITVYCDKEYNINKMVVHESYTVYVVGRNDSDAVNNVYFFHNSDETIPELTEDFNYGGY